MIRSIAEYGSCLVDLRKAELLLPALADGELLDLRAGSTWVSAVLAFSEKQQAVASLSFSKGPMEWSWSSWGPIEIYEIAVSKFAAEVGASMVETNGALLSAACLGALAAKQVQLATVHRDVLESGSPSPQALAYLLVTQEGLELPAETQVSVNKNDIATFCDRLDFWRTFQHFMKYVEVAKPATMRLPQHLFRSGATVPEGGATECSSEHAVTIFKLLCLVRAVAMAAKAANDAVFARLKSVDTMEFGAAITHILFLQHTVTELEKAVVDPAALDAERMPLPLAVPINSIRQWTANMGVFGGVLQKQFLLCVQGLIDEACSRGAAARPPWDAAITAEGFDYPLAKAITQGKSSKVVQLHNMLHRVLSKVGDASQQIGLSPRLQDHELTRESVAVAKNTMAKLAQDAVVIDGVQLIGMATHHANGSSLAKDFLKQHDVAKNNSIPQPFWTELKAIASDAATRLAPADVTPLVKLEA